MTNSSPLAVIKRNWRLTVLNSINDSLKSTLLQGVESGLWTLEQLDRPTTSWVSNTRVDRRFFKDGYQGIQHRNLLRDSGYTPDPTTNDDLPF